METERQSVHRGAVLLLSLALPAAVSSSGEPWKATSNRSGSQECSADLLGGWTGTLDVGRLFGVRFTIAEQRPGEFASRIDFGDREEVVAVWRQDDRIRFQSNTRPIAFDGRVPSHDAPIDAFVQYASHLVHTRVPQVSDEAGRAWSTEWTFLGVPAAEVRFDLYIGEEGGRVAGGYFFFRDQRLPSLYGEGITCDGSMVRLSERNLGLRFEGRFDRGDDALQLTATGLGASVPITFRRMVDAELPDPPDAPEATPRDPASSAYRERAPEGLADGWATAAPSDEGVDPAVIAEMVRAIVEQEMTFTHSVLVARHGRLVVEEYFYGFDRETWHDMRSASKTVASTLVGLAVRDGYIESAESPALQYLPYRQYANWDARKARITLRDLLTMSSGLDANDSDQNSVASEGAYQLQRSRPDWVKLALDAPMIGEPGAQPIYGGANPLILGGVLAATVPEPVEWFAHRNLFGPLGIAEYKWFMDPTGRLYMGGGLHLRPRDMAKFGQLYLDGGVWRGERILSDEWVRESWGRYGRLAPLDVNGHHYGYLWWHHQYEVSDTIVETLEARGNGGQYIFVVPSLDLVAVITSGNFRNRRTRQPEEILQRFILPAVR